jgi:hypothetical protein
MAISRAILRPSVLSSFAIFGDSPETEDAENLLGAGRRDV